MVLRPCNLIRRLLATMNCTVRLLATMNCTVMLTSMKQCKLTRADLAEGLGGWGGVKYRMLHIPGILDCTYHLHVSCLCAQGSSIAEYLDYSP